MKPTVGRIVHYVSYGTPGGEYRKECRAAIVTEVTGGALRPPDMTETDLWVVGLCVLNPAGQFFNRGVVQMEDAHDGGTWHWPEREGPMCTVHGDSANTVRRPNRDPLNFAAGEYSGPPVLASALAPVPAGKREIDVTSPDPPDGAHDYHIDGAGREWYRDAEDLWWIKPTPDSPWFRQRVT